MSTLENVGAEALAPADELLGVLDELLGVLDEPDAPEAPLELLSVELEPDALGVDDELLGLELEDDELCAIALAANNAATMATLVLSM